MEIPAKYDPQSTEEKWYRFWLDKGFFKSVPDEREPYTIVIPPPNVTGVLHMGHMLNNTIQDVLVRRARMQGKNACWVPGTDHASIATEAKVVAKLAAEGISKNDLTRDEFLNHAWEWTHKHGGIILEQLKGLGASCDWDRTCFTMDEPRSESVIKVFIDLYNKGLIYRGVRMVNWDPQALTALSDEEVIHKEVNGKLYYLRYKIEGEDGYAVIATTRPETIFGDVAVCINPNDEKTAALKGKKVIVPIVNRVVPIIEDDYVDVEFGTGFLKVTPAHDINDYMLGEKYNLEKINIFNDNGTLNGEWDVNQESLGLSNYIGMDRFEARTQIEKDLDTLGLLEKTEAYTNKVGFSERTDAVIEPKLSMQWFLKMEKLSKPALKAVMDDDITIYPAKFKNTYYHWMENVKDWCISRQLWWGHRIPVWYYQVEKNYAYQSPLPTTNSIVAQNEEEAISKIVEIYKKKNYSPNEIEELLKKVKQEEDVLDTWFSSWLWPISVFDGIRNPENKDIQYYYPTNDLVTAPEILFFWVARMIIAGYEYRETFPFKNVYLTGIVRDKLGRKMSKSLGNSPDPLELIAKYSADGVRMGMLLSSPAGNDLPFDESLTEQGRNFGNKIWNAFRLVKGWEVSETIAQPIHSARGIEWFANKLNRTIAEINDDFNEYRLSEALMRVYKLFWDDFSGWYLEIVKPEYQQPIDKATLDATIGFFDDLLHLLHPFMPFMTEEIWHLIAERKENESLMVSLQPKGGAYDEVLLDRFDQLAETIAAIRTIRKNQNVPMRDTVELFIAKTSDYSDFFESILSKMCRLSSISETTEKIENAASFRIKTTEFYVVTGVTVNIEEERQKLQAELEYQKGFLASVMKKLSNERFVSSAPAQVVEIERNKQRDAETKIQAIEERLKSL
jgi:valyl-tRNA synthetase